MGKVRVTKYRIEYNSTHGQQVVGYDHKLTSEGLQRWCEGMERSCLKGGVNEHLSADGRLPLLAIHSAVMIEQRHGVTVASYHAAPFRVF